MGFNVYQSLCNTRTGLDPWTSLYERHFPGIAGRGRISPDHVVVLPKDAPHVWADNRNNAALG